MTMFTKIEQVKEIQNKGSEIYSDSWDSLL